MRTAAPSSYLTADLERGPVHRPDGIKPCTACGLMPPARQHAIAPGSAATINGALDLRHRYRTDSNG